MSAPVLQTVVIGPRPILRQPNVTVNRVLSSGVRPRVAASDTAVLSVLATLMLTVATGCTTGSPEHSMPTQSVITSTTVIAGAGVLGNQRQPDDSCPAEPAPADPGASPRQVANAAGVSPAAVEVPADPQRLVVLAGDQLDALCALGLQSRIVGTGLPQPSYLGTVVHDASGVGPREAPDLAAVAAATPELILGSQAATPDLYPDLAAIAPTLFTAAAGAGWQANLRAVAEATGRSDAVAGLFDRFTDQADRIRARADTGHYQASIVEITENAVRIYGVVNFPASVLTAAGLDRPPAQRFTDRPFIEVDAGSAALRGGADFSAADADIVYVSFSTPAAKDRAPEVFDSEPWRKLSANRDNRVFVVNNEVWQTGQGLIAAHGILDDLQWVNAPIN